MTLFDKLGRGLLTFIDDRVVSRRFLTERRFERCFESETGVTCDHVFINGRINRTAFFDLVDEKFGENIV